MVNRINNSANNIFSSSDNMLSRTRSTDNSFSEADYRALSRKDRVDVTSIKKDELEYQITNDMRDQEKQFRDEEWERLGGLFQD